MVSTRSAGPDELAHADHVEESSVTIKIEDGASSNELAAQKRKDAPTNEQGDIKRRQLTPPRELAQERSASTKHEAGLDVDAESAPQAAAEASSVPPPTLALKAEPEIDELIDVSRRLLKTFTHTSFDYLTQIVSRPTSRKGREYRALYERFKNARTELPTTDNFVVITKGQTAPETDASIRRTNIVTFAASMLGSRDASFRQLNKYFFTTFVGTSGRLLQEHADILLGLKTQAYISQALDAKTVRGDILNDLFPSDMASQILALRQDVANSTLLSSEHKFIKQLSNRRRSLSEKTTPTSIIALKTKYSWNEVLTNMMTYIKQHFADLAEIPADQIESLNDDGEREADVHEVVAPKPSQAKRATSPSNGAAKITQAQAISQNPPHASSITTGNTTSLTPGHTHTKMDTSYAPQSGFAPEDVDLTEILSQASRAADTVILELEQGNLLALQHQGSSTEALYSAQYTKPGAANVNAPMPPQYALPQGTSSQYSQGHGSPYAPADTQQWPAQGSSQGHADPSAPVHPGGQTQPTHQLYEMARQATTGRVTQTSSSRRQTGQSQRRPWTTEEEQALMKGLDQVKGPHWSMILQLYGSNGKISDVLRDRNQVQLKDKARNLKLWFLKSGVEVPVNLKNVTGELKTRAPAAIRNASQQAAANASHASHTHAPSTSSQPHSPHNYQPATSAYAPSTAGVYAANTPPQTTTPGSGQLSGYTTAGPQDAFPDVHASDDAFWVQQAADAAASAVAGLRQFLGDDIVDSIGQEGQHSGPAELAAPLNPESAQNANGTVEDGPGITDSQTLVNDQTPTLAADPQNATEPTAVAAEEGNETNTVFAKDEQQVPAEQALVATAEDHTQPADLGSFGGTDADMDSGAVQASEAPYEFDQEAIEAAAAAAAASVKLEDF